MKKREMKEKNSNFSLERTPAERYWESPEGREEIKKSLAESYEIERRIVEELRRKGEKI